MTSEVPAGKRVRSAFARMIILAISLVPVALPAATNEWTPTRSFRTFSKSNWRGLPQSSVAALAQSTDGVLWIGTLDGVASFDGKSITPVPSEPGAPLRGVITPIVARAKGGVYVGSSDGVHVLDAGVWRLVPTKRGVASLAESRDGVLWMVDGDGGLFTLGANESWQRHPEMTAPVIAVSAAPDGAVWAATDSGAARMAGGRVEMVAGPPLPGRPSALLVASDGRVWVATQTCTVHWTRGGSDGWHQAAFTPWPRGAFRCLAEDRRGRIWAGSFGGHVAFGTADSAWTVWGLENGPFEAGVNSILCDREGTVWFGLNAVGLAQWIGEAWSHRPMADPSNPTRALFSAFGLSRSAAPHAILVAAFNAGALKLDANGMKQYGMADGLTEDVRAVVEPEPGTLVAGTRFGIFESKGNKPFRQTLKLPSGLVMGLFKSPDGRWYAATSTMGVYVRNGETWRPEETINASLDNKHVRGMMWRPNGELWVSTLRGITIFHGSSPAVHLSSANERAIPESVNATLEVAGDEIWAAGTGGIAVRRQGKWSRMTEGDGIPGQTVYSLVLGPDGAVWAGGSAGVGRFAQGRWKVWDSREGLLQEECNLNGLLVGDDSAVYVSTMAGLARFDPTIKPLPLPKLAVHWLATPKLDASGVAHISSEDRALHLRWNAPWLDPHPVQYRVRIPRLREEWSAPGPDDHLDIENLSAGSWRVDVAARVEGTNEWSAPLSLDVDVAPLWYERLPARAAMAALLVLAIYGLVRLRLRALRKHAAALEATVHERTAQLAEKVDALRDSEQRALAASRAKSAFLANMSHELRTPLNGILGFAQLLGRRKNRDAEDQQGLSVITSSGEHLLDLINNVLSLSKIEAGRITLEERRFDIRAVVRDVENVLRLRAEEKRIAFSAQIDPTNLPAAVTGDEVRLRQILLNLAGNAVKFTDAGGVTLRVSWRDGRARFDVEDTGPGIAPADLGRLFEPFAQSETGQRSKEGTGLGLALSRDLARLMNGDITVASTLGQGSRFTLVASLPEAPAALILDAERQRVTGLAPGQVAVRVLIVDDTPINRVILSRLLLPVGFEVREASTGEDALDTWRNWQPHVIWMDKRMPGIDGLEVTRRIRAEEQRTGRERVSIIALSASALDHERGEILDAGCDDFVAKPFREATIFAKLHEHLGVRYVFDDGAGETVPSAPAPAGDSTLAHGDAHVLLVDDDWICREVAVAMLRVNRVGVTAVSSGREALDLLASNRFDLVFMDLQMPDMGGIETARRIKANPGTAKLPVIAMSADTFDGESARLAEAGMDDYVAKPVEPEALEETLKRWLPARRAL